jgi:hypothetical protein
MVPEAMKSAFAPAMAWIGITTLALAGHWVVAPPQWSLEMAFLAVFGFFGCARPLRLGSKMELSMAQPVAFAALLLVDTSTAAMVVIACTLGALVLRRRRLPGIKAAFNLAVGVSTVLAAGAVLSLLRSSAGALTPETLPPLLAATGVAFPLATLPVAVVAARGTGSHAGALWVKHFLPMAPSFLAGSGLAVILVLGLTSLGPYSFAFFVPLALSLLQASARSMKVR